MVNVTVRDPESLARFLETKNSCKVTSIGSEESDLGNGSFHSEEEADGHSAAEYFEALVSPKKASGNARFWEDRTRHLGLFDPRYLQIEDLKLDIDLESDTLVFVTKTVLTDGEAEFLVIFEGQVPDYPSSEMIGEDIKIAKREEEVQLREALSEIYSG